VLGIYDFVEEEKGGTVNEKEIELQGFSSHSCREHSAYAVQVVKIHFPPKFVYYSDCSASMTAI
jgi:hypothetical protein